MGDPKKQRKKYSKPSHPWQAERIEEENALIKEYGLKNKKEIWKIKSLLKRFSDQIKRLIASSEKQAEKEKVNLLNKLKKLKLVSNSAQLEDVLNISLRDIMDRRLQTIVFKQGLTMSVKQARQAIVHKHIVIGDRMVTNSGYLVSGKEESKIAFAPKSAFSNPEHPERTSKKESSKKKVSEEKNEK